MFVLIVLLLVLKVAQSGFHHAFLLGRWVEPHTDFSERGGLTGSQFFQGDCWERGG